MNAKDIKLKMVATHNNDVSPVTDLETYLSILSSGEYGRPGDQIIFLFGSGLKDSNGKEIFAGDIYQVDGEKEYYQVFYKDGAFCGGKREDHAEPLAWDYWEGSDEFTSEWPWSICKFEVVGNIYENPELLEVNNEND